MAGLPVFRFRLAGRWPVRALCAGFAVIALAPLPAAADNTPPVGVPPIKTAPSPIATPSPTATPPPPSPSPTPQGQLGIDPSAAPPGSLLHLVGSGFPASRTFTALWDSRPFATVAADGAGNFNQPVTVPDFATGPDHQVCLQQQSGTVCAGFRLLPPPPSPSPSPSPSPEPSPSPSADPSPATSPTAGGAGPGRSGPSFSDGSPFASLTHPPGIFFPILLLLAALIGGLYWYFVLREPAAVNEVTILHRSAPYRSGSYDADPSLENPGPAPAPPPPAPVAQGEPIVYESPSSPAPGPPPPPRHQPPAGADVPPDLPEASD